MVVGHTYELARELSVYRDRLGGDLPYDRGIQQVKVIGWDARDVRVDLGLCGHDERDAALRPDPENRTAVPFAELLITRMGVSGNPRDRGVE